MKRVTFAALISLSLVNGVVQVQAAPLTFESRESQATLIELYTSEGCSSCPPAEKWLSGLKENTGLWRDFVPVAFHVDYWDYLGWRDPWSAKAFSARQRAYARVWGSGNIYTPGFVLNGSEWRDWASRKIKPSLAKPGVLKISSDDSNHWQIVFTPTTPGDSKFDACAAFLASGLSSDVKAGENAGRRLEHDFVVLSLARESLSSREGAFRTALTFDKSQKAIGGRLGVAVWVTRRNSLEVLQATGGWLTQ